MITLVLWFLAAFGFAFVVGHSKISLPVRTLLAGQSARAVEIERDRVAYELDYEKGVSIRATTTLPAVRPLVPVLGPFLVALVECPGCLGWWLGLGAGVLWPVLSMPMEFPRYAFALALAFSTSAVNLLLAKYVGMV